MMGMNVIYCSPWSGNLMSCGVWMICSVAGVVCHGGFCGFGLGVLNGVALIWDCLCPSHCYDVEWPLYRSQWLELWCLLYLDHDLDLSLLFQSPWQYLELDLVWQFSYALLMLWWCAWRQYFVRLYVHILHIHGIWCEGSAMWCVLVLGIEKHLSSSFNSMLTIDDKRMVVVSCFAASSFSTSVMVSFGVFGSFS